MDENRVSPTQTVIGLVGLAIAIWGLAGGPHIADSSALRWGAIGLTILVGIVLIVVGGLSGRKR